MTEAKPKIAICIGTRGMLSVRFVTDVYIELACQVLPWCDKQTIIFEGNFGVVPVRNRLVDIAMDSGADWIWFLDDDILFPNQDPNEVLKKLYDTGQPIVSGLVRTKKVESYGKHEYSAYVTDGKKFHSVIKWTPGADSIPVDATGLACCLIKREVFAGMDKPYFHWDTTEEEGEDMWFMDKARKLGYKVTLRTDIKLSHHGQFILNADGSVTATKGQEFINSAGSW